MTGPNFARLLTVRSALQLEIIGMKRSRPPSAYMIAKRLYNLQGSKERVRDQLDNLINNEKVRRATIEFLKGDST
jgi:hypothetical protein